MRRNASVHACIHQTRRSLFQKKKKRRRGSGLRKRVWKEGLCEIASNTDHGSNRRKIWLRACNNAHGLLLLFCALRCRISPSFFYPVYPHRFSRCTVVGGLFVFLCIRWWGEIVRVEEKKVRCEGCIDIRFSWAHFVVCWFVCLFNYYYNNYDNKNISTDYNLWAQCVTIPISMC
jgi:hypothetical protein